MTKKFTKMSTLLLLMAFILSPILVFPVNAEDATETTEDVIDLVEGTESDEEEDVDVDDFSDDELTEAEPSDLPDVEEDEVLTKRMYGKMLLDVEGNGEVYYVDPVTGGKEYLADGASAHRLLERRALGINEENFAKLVMGETRDDESVCETAELGERLKGRIVIRTEESGEAYWIYPENCRAYYVGTFDAAYKLMKKMSLGIIKANLAKVRNNKRQRIKSNFRVILYAYAEDNDVNLVEAREGLRGEVQATHQCMQESGIEPDDDTTREERLEQAKICLEGSDFPEITLERRGEIKQTIREARQERLQSGAKLGELRIVNLFNRIRQMRNQAQ